MSNVTPWTYYEIKPSWPMIHASAYIIRDGSGNKVAEVYKESDAKLIISSVSLCAIIAN